MPSGQCRQGNAARAMPPWIRSLRHVLPKRALRVDYMDNNVSEYTNEYISEFDVTFVNGMDKNGRIMVDYGVTGLPVTFFLDREGMIIGRWVGSIGASSLESRVEALENGSFQSLYGSDKNKSGFRSLN